MTRSAARELAVQLCFAMEYGAADAAALLDEFLESEHYVSLKGEDELYFEKPDAGDRAYIEAIVSGVAEKGDELDGYISKYAKNWKLSRISRIARAIMRTAIYEMLYMDGVPVAAAASEAVKIAKGYEEAETVSFINGVLGSFIRAEIQKGSAESGEQ